MVNSKNLSKMIFIITLIVLGTRTIIQSQGSSREIEFEELGFISTYGAFDVWVEGELAYVTCGYQGMRIFNISNPASITELGVLGQPSDGYAHQLFIEDNLAYIGNGRGGIQIVNVSDPRNPSILNNFKGLGLYAWDVKIVDDIAFVASGLLGGFEPGLTILNISNPNNPLTLGRFDTGGVGIDLEVMNNFVYILSGYSGFTIIDVTNKSNPTAISQYKGDDDPQANSNEIELADNLLILAKYQNEPKILNISNPINIELIADDFLGISNSFSAEYEDGLLYITAFENGLFVFDINNPMKPIRIGQFTEVEGIAYRMEIIGDKIYITYQDEGLRILEMKEKSLSSPGLEVALVLFGLIFISILTKYTFKIKRKK